MTLLFIGLAAWIGLALFAIAICAAAGRADRDAAALPQPSPSPTPHPQRAARRSVSLRGAPGPRLPA